MSLPKIGIFKTYTAQQLNENETLDAWLQFCATPIFFHPEWNLEQFHFLLLRRVAAYQILLSKRREKEIFQSEEVEWDLEGILGSDVLPSDASSRVIVGKIMECSPSPSWGLESVVSEWRRLKKSGLRTIESANDGKFGFFNRLRVLSLSKRVQKKERNLSNAINTEQYHFQNEAYFSCVDALEKNHFHRLMLQGLVPKNASAYAKSTLRMILLCKKLEEFKKTKEQSIAAVCHTIKDAEARKADLERTMTQVKDWKKARALEASAESVFAETCSWKQELQRIGAQQEEEIVKEYEIRKIIERDLRV